MIVRCTHCRKELQLPDGQISESGTRVLCPLCKTIFIARKVVKRRDSPLTPAPRSEISESSPPRPTGGDGPDLPFEDFSPRRTPPPPPPPPPAAARSSGLGGGPAAPGPATSPGGPAGVSPTGGTPTGVSPTGGTPTGGTEDVDSGTFDLASDLASGGSDLFDEGSHPARADETGGPEDDHVAGLQASADELFGEHDEHGDPFGELAGGGAGAHAGGASPLEDLSAGGGAGDLPGEPGAAEPEMDLDLGLGLGDDEDLFASPGDAGGRGADPGNGGAPASAPGPPPRTARPPAAGGGPHPGQGAGPFGATRGDEDLFGDGPGGDEGAGISVTFDEPFDEPGAAGQAGAYPAGAEDDFFGSSGPSGEEGVGAPPEAGLDAERASDLDDIFGESAAGPDLGQGLGAEAPPAPGPMAPDPWGQRQDDEAYTAPAPERDEAVVKAPAAARPGQAGTGASTARRATAKRWRPSRGLVAAVLVVTVLGGAGGYLWLEQRDLVLGSIDKVVELVRSKTVTGSDEAPTGRIEVEDPQGTVKRVNDRDYFVITGTVRNAFSHPVALIQVRGTLFNGKGGKVNEKTVYAGHTVDGEDLQAKKPADLDQLLYTKFGDNLNNVSVGAGSAIPFTVVFFDIPPDVEHFEVSAFTSNESS